MTTAPWIALLAGVLDLLRRLVIFWSGKMASRERNSDEARNAKAESHDKLLIALKARRNAANELRFGKPAPPGKTDSDPGDNLPGADRMSIDRYQRD